MHRIQVQSLVGELRSHVVQGKVHTPQLVSLHKTTREKPECNSEDPACHN